MFYSVYIFEMIATYTSSIDSFVSYISIKPGETLGAKRVQPQGQKNEE